MEAPVADFSVLPMLPPVDPACANALDGEASASAAIAANVRICIRSRLAVRLAVIGLPRDAARSSTITRIVRWLVKD